MRPIFVILTLLKFLQSEVYAYSTTQAPSTQLNQRGIISSTTSKESENFATTKLPDENGMTVSIGQHADNITSKREDFIPTIGSFSTKNMMQRARMGRGMPGGAGGGGGITIKRPLPPTLPPLPTTRKPSTIPTTKQPLSTPELTTARRTDVVSSSFSPSSSLSWIGQTTDTSGPTDMNTDSPGKGGLSTMTAFMVGLGVGISGLLVVVVVVCVCYCRIKKQNDNKYRVGGSEGEETQQYMQLSISRGPGQEHVVSGSMENHTYEEARMMGPVLPQSPPVPTRVPETRYSSCPEVVISRDGYTIYRPSDSDQSNESQQSEGVSQYLQPFESGSQIAVIPDGTSGSTVIKSSTSSGAYTGLTNVPRRPTIVGQDGYAEYIDERKSQQESSAQPNSRNKESDRSIHARGYTQYRPSSEKPVSYTDLTTGQKEASGYTKYNGSIHQPEKSTYTDLRTGQDRRLPSPPTDNNVTGPEPLTYRHASVGSLGSISETLDIGDRLTVGHELAGGVHKNRNRSISSVSDDSCYTIPNDIGSLNYEEVGPDITSPHIHEQSQRSPTVGVYIDLDDFYEGKPNERLGANVPLPGSEVCEDPKPESHYYFKFQPPADKVDSQSPYYFKVDGLQSRQPQISENNNKEANERPYYSKVTKLGKQTTRETTIDQTQQVTESETPEYFQLEKSVSSSVCRNTDERNSKEKQEQVPANTKRSTSVSLPHSDEAISNYQHLVRSVTLPPNSVIIEGSHYQELKRDNKV